MDLSKLPRRFAIAGLLIGILCVGFYWFDIKYNPFHLPAADAPEAIRNYSAPKIYDYCYNSTYIVCPGQLLQIFDMSKSDKMNWLFWIPGVLLNAPIYYAIGMAIAAVTKRRT